MGGGQRAIVKMGLLGPFAEKIRAWVIGWFSVNVRIAPGMVCVGTKALETKVSGKINTKPTHCAASRLLTSSPRMADSHEIASVNSSASPMTYSHSAALAFVIDYRMARQLILDQSPDFELLVQEIEGVALENAVRTIAL